MTEEKFLYATEIDVFSFGRPPNALDIMIDLKGMDFQEFYELSEFYETEETKVRLIHYKHLIAAKKAAGRPKDLVDIIYLEKE